MPHEGYVDPVMNDGPEFRSNVPVSELTERVTQAIEASDVSSAHSVAETVDGVTHGTRPTPAITAVERFVCWLFEILRNFIGLSGLYGPKYDGLIASVIAIVLVLL